MLFGVAINTWYAIVIGMVLFCLVLVAIVMIRNEIINWRAVRKRVRKAYEEVEEKNNNRG
jgi:hypothetical protein